MKSAVAHQIVDLRHREQLLPRLYALLRQSAVSFSHSHLARGGVQIEKRGSHLDISSPAQVFLVGTPLPQGSIGLFNIRLHHVFLPDWKAHRPGDVEHAVRVIGCRADNAVVPRHRWCSICPCAV